MQYSEIFAVDAHILHVVFIIVIRDGLLRRLRMRLNCDKLFLLFRRV